MLGITDANSYTKIPKTEPVDLHLLLESLNRSDQWWFRVDTAFYISWTIRHCGSRRSSAASMFGSSNLPLMQFENTVKISDHHRFHLTQAYLESLLYLYRRVQSPRGL